MVKEKIKCLYVEESKLPIEINIENNLTCKQKQVKGYIEYYDLDNNVSIICNEEGKINGMHPNRDVGNDIIFGPFLIVGYDCKSGDDCSLTDEQIIFYKQRFDEKSIDETIKKYELIHMGYEL